jgi:hypothetical protein
MLATLQIVIGIVFVMLLISLFASVILEFAAGILSLRGKHLSNAIKVMLGDSLYLEFVKHPYFQQLATGSTQKVKVDNEKTAFPSYIDANSFSSILVDTLKLDAPEGVDQRIAMMPPGTSQQMMVFLYNQSDSVPLLQRRIESWYEQVMARASGAYKRDTQRWLFGLGLVLALLLNADALAIYHNLSINSSLREAMNAAASNFVAVKPAISSANSLTVPTAASNETYQRINDIVNSNIGAFEAPLGVGWSTFDPASIDGLGWLFKLGGWLMTALAVSFGASFWFELLKKIMNVRSTGSVPASPAPTPQPMPTQMPPASYPSSAPFPDNGAAGFAPPRPDGVLLRPDDGFRMESRSAQAPPGDEPAKPAAWGKIPRNYQ